MNEEANRWGDRIINMEIGFIIGMVCTVLAEHWWNVIA